MGTIRSRSSVLLVVLSLLGSGLVLAFGAAPAQAAWTNAGGLVHHRVCKEATPAGTGWIYVNRVRKRAHTRDARAGAVVFVDGRRRQAWSSGWLQGRRAEEGAVRHRRQRGVRIQVWQEAGDRDSAIGTALERSVLRPRDVARC